MDEHPKNSPNERENYNEVDAWPLGWKKNKKEKEQDQENKPERVFPSDVIQRPTVSSGKHDWYYNMDNPKRGVALIFNHTDFNRMPRRDGTEHDRNRIIKVLKYLHFEPRVYDDLSYYEILDTLDAFVEENHTDEDCLIIVVMSHGNSGILYARDHQYPVDLLWNKITGDKCPTLAGKPKLIFIQACRGDEVDAGVQLASRTGDQVDTVAKNSAAYTIPANADILVMYSTFAGHTSFRIPQVGSWFIQSLCTELEEKAKSHSLLDILTFTTRRVAVDYVSRMSDPRTDKRKQIPSIVSHLTRILHFGESNKILI